MPGVTLDAGGMIALDRNDRESCEVIPVEPETCRRCLPAPAAGAG